MSPRSRSVAATGMAYFLLALSAVSFTRLSGGIALMWPANAVLISALMTRPPRRWAPVVVAVVVAGSLVSLLVSHSGLRGVLLTLANAGEALVAAGLLHRFHRHLPLFESLRSLVVFVAAAAIAAPLASGLPGALIGHWSMGQPFWSMLGDWVVGHGLGTLIAMPVVQVIRRAEISAWWHGSSSWGATRAFALLALTALVCAGVFAWRADSVLFVTVPPVLAASFVLGRPGAALSMLIVALVGGSFTVAGHGPIANVSVNEAVQLQFFQFYLATLLLMALPITASLTARRRLLNRMQQNEAALRMLTDNLSDMLLSLDRDGEIRFASASARELGHDPDYLVGRQALELVDPDDHDLLRQAHRRALADPDHNVTTEYRGFHVNGSVAWFESNTRAVRDVDGAVTGTVSTIRDVTRRKSVEHRLIRQASTDPLTGVANRRAFMAALEGAAAGSRPATLAMLDVDHFKQVNDRYGHSMGDAALTTLADCCRQMLRGSDLIGRLGGEEFALLLAGAELNEAVTICDRLRAALAQRVVATTPEGALRITASFGLAAVPPDGAPEAILATADRALYEAKEAGRNCLRIAG
ncbi:MAG: diguanylate cyclase [Sphingomonas sp.]